MSPRMHERAELVRGLYDIVRAHSGRTVVIDSSKAVNRFRLLHALEPNRNKAIFLTRDGRAYVAGNLARNQLEPPESSEEWRFTNTYSRRMLGKAPADSWIHVRYEELCRDPEATVRRICEFTGLAFEPEMLHFREQESHNIGGNRMRLGSAAEIREDTKWREALTADQREVFERIGGDLNRELLGEFYMP